MKQGIHPKYFDKATVTCACGAVLTTGSTVETMNVEICAHCHPFYTGKKKNIDTTGRVDRFKKLTEKAEALKTGSRSKTAKRQQKSAAKKEKKATAK